MFALWRTLGKQLLQSTDCVAERDEAIAAVTDARQLDALYRRALDFATRSYCQIA